MCECMYMYVYNFFLNYNTGNILNIAIAILIILEYINFFKCQNMKNLMFFKHLI